MDSRDENINTKDFNYHQILETPDIFKNITSKDFLNEDIKGILIPLDESGGMTNPIAVNSFCKSSSSSSDACSSSRLLDMPQDDSLTRILSPSGYESNFYDFKSPFSIRNPIYPLNEIPGFMMDKNNQLGSSESSTGINPDMDPVWVKLQNNITDKMRKKFLRQTKKKSSHECPSEDLDDQRRHCGKPFCCIKKANDDHWTCFKYIVLGLLVFCAFTILILIGFTITSYFLENSIKSNQIKSNDYFRRIYKWWEDPGVFYEIFPASFKDSDADGFGDLIGLKNKIPYLKELGITEVRLNSIFSALDYPYQYEHVIDFDSLDPHLGTREDLINCINELHAQGIHVILDMNPTITSDQHPWAAHWVIDPTGPYQYYYVNETKDELSITSTTASDRISIMMSEVHLSFGFHLYLNWSHPPVKHKMLNSIREWIKTGIDGFYIKDVHRLQVDDYFEIYDIIDDIRRCVDGDDNLEAENSKHPDDERRNGIKMNRKPKNKRKRILIAGRQELLSLVEKISNTRKFIDLMENHKSRTNHSKDQLDQLPDVFSFFDLLEVSLEINLNSTENLRDQINAVYLNTPKSHPWVLWNVGTSTKSRLGTRIGDEFIGVSSFLLIMLPGSISIFYGDEIGLKDSVDTNSNREYRGGQLCPMAWSASNNANFTFSNKTLPWLPLNGNHIKNNVQLQSEAILRLQQLIAFRKYNFNINFIEKQGNYLFHYINEGQLVLERYFSRRNHSTSFVDTITRSRYVLFANLSNQTKVKDFSDKFHFGRIKVATKAKRIQDFLYLRSLKLDPGEAIISEVQ